MRIIAGEFRGRALKTTTGPGFRPAMGRVREALFSMLEARQAVGPETRVLDLFAGGGSLGFEALSRGAAHATFVENAPYAVKVLEANAELLGLTPERCSIRREEAQKFLRKAPAVPYDLVFIDPPYKDNVLGAVLKALCAGHFLAPGAVVDAEVESHLRFEPETAHPELELQVDRTYGQTRVILWTMKSKQPSTPEPSTP